MLILLLLHINTMILGCDVLSELGIMLDFKDPTMTWDDSTIRMKDPESFPDLLEQINDLFWSTDLYKDRWHFKRLAAHLQKNLDAKYTPADLDKVVWMCRHLTDDKKCQLHMPY